jgi:predicted hotdog family 3-hydroxylacyl-ACP dehydratase
MCLLDEVLTWGADAVECRTSTHRAPANPLRRAGRLGALAAIEYAAQAMAVHAALLAGSDDGATPGYLASVRDVTLLVDRLDTLPGDLVARAERITSGERTALYAFQIYGPASVVASGRAVVVFGSR